MMSSIESMTETRMVGGTRTNSPGRRCGFLSRHAIFRLRAHKVAEEKVTVVEEEEENGEERDSAQTHKVSDARLISHPSPVLTQEEERGLGGGGAEEASEEASYRSSAA